MAKHLLHQVLCSVHSGTICINYPLLLNMATAGFGPLSGALLLVLRHSFQVPPLPGWLHCLRMAWGPLSCVLPSCPPPPAEVPSNRAWAWSFSGPSAWHEAKTGLAASGLLHAEWFCLRSFREKFSKVYSTESWFYGLSVAIIWKKKKKVFEGSVSFGKP